MDIDKVYEKAVENGLLPGFALMAGNKEGQLKHGR